MTRPRGHEDRCTRLLLRAKRGDTESFAELYTALRPAVRDFAGSLDGTLSAHDREDLVQEAFLAAWKRLGRYRGDASAKTFVLAIAKNLLLKHIFTRRRLAIIYTPDLDYVPDRGAPAGSTGSSSMSPEEVRRTVRLAMAKLGGAQRRAAELDLSCNSRTAAVEAANCSHGQFADRLYQARKRLRQMLKGLLGRVLL